MKIFQNFWDFGKWLIVKFHFLIFNSPPGEFSKRLIKNLFFAFFGIGGASLITFGFNILAIRFLGPTELGKWNLIGGIAEFFVILPLWGLTYGSLRYLGAEREKKEEIIGTAFRIFFLLTLLFFFIYLTLAPFLKTFLRIDSSLYNFALLYAFILVFFYLFQSFFQGLEEFKKLSFLLIGSAFIFSALVSFYLFIFHNFSFESLFWGNFWRLSIIIIAGFLIFRKSLLKFNYQTFKKIFSYSTFQMFSVFAGFFSLGHIDNLMINYFLGQKAVGLYSAYYLGFSIFVGRILNTFSQVFLPMASNLGEIKELFKRWKILAKKSGIIVLALIFFLIWLLFKFYGEQFIFDWRLAILMALNITLYGFLMILGNIIASIGIKGAKIGTIFAFSSAFLNVVLNYLLIPKFQLFGAVFATLITILTIMIIAIYVLKFKLNQNGNKKID